jgi:hypothetical protein
MRRKALTGPLRHLCLWAVVVLFGAFSALAPGTMPERQQGALTMVLCTGHGVETVTIGPDGTPVEPEHKPCDWNQHPLAALRKGLAVAPLAAAFDPAPPLPPAPRARPIPRRAAVKRARAPPPVL